MPYDDDFNYIPDDDDDIPTGPPTCWEVVGIIGIVLAALIFICGPFLSVF